MRLFDVYVVVVDDEDFHFLYAARIIITLNSIAPIYRHKKYFHLLHRRNVMFTMHKQSPGPVK